MPRDAEGHQSNKSLLLNPPAPFFRPPSPEDLFPRVLDFRPVPKTHHSSLPLSLHIIFQPISVALPLLLFCFLASISQRRTSSFSIEPGPGDAARQRGGGTKKTQGTAHARGDTGAAQGAAKRAETHGNASESVVRHASKVDETNATCATRRLEKKGAAQRPQSGGGEREKREKGLKRCRSRRRTQNGKRGGCGIRQRERNGTGRNT